MTVCLLATQKQLAKMVPCANVFTANLHLLLFPLQGVQQAEALPHPLRRRLLLHLQHTKVLSSNAGTAILVIISQVFFCPRLGLATGNTVILTLVLIKHILCLPLGQKMSLNQFYGPGQ